MFYDRNLPNLGIELLFIYALQIRLSMFFLLSFIYSVLISQNLSFIPSPEDGRPPQPSYRTSVSRSHM